MHRGVVVATVQRSRSAAMSDERLTEELARQVMSWRSAPGRFLMSNRRWIPRWRFQPIKNLSDAFKLLEAAAPQEYTMGGTRHGGFWVRVQMAGAIGTARDRSKPRAITLAVAQALGVDVA